MNSNNRIAATLFPRDIVCLRNISINTLHIRDDDDDDININNNSENIQSLLTENILHIILYDKNTRCKKCK